MTGDAPDWEFKPRDVYVLRELSRDPQLSSRDLARILEEKYDIDVSHVTVSESIRGMREHGVFREAVAQAVVFDSHDHAEGATAFLEGREPKFEGR
jgi:enoyl-CoA hydratase/carnithine racemase